MGNKHSNAKCQCPKNAKKHKHHDPRHHSAQCNERQLSKQHQQPTTNQQEKQHLQQKLHSPFHTNVVHCGPGHASQTSSWLPPLENWEAGSDALPYGWEAATDKEGKPYFINHLNKTTTYEDPRKDYLDEPPQPRQIDLVRDPEMGFGFVAGSEKPVIVRFVTEGGPSVEKLLPGDQILMINGEDVKKAPRDHVIQLVRSCKDKVQLTVTQPPLDNSARKSALLSAAKKQRLKNNPSRVRFAESVDINGSSSYSPSNFNSSESTTPFMPNVLKVFLENGQTKSFKYDSSTTVGDVLDSLHQKLGIKCPEHFSLVVEHVKSLRRNKLTILDPRETLSRIAARPGAQHLRCLYRVTFVPRDAYDLLRKDSMAFEYLYLQVNTPITRGFSSFSPLFRSHAPPSKFSPLLQSTRNMTTTPWLETDIHNPLSMSSDTENFELLQSNFELLQPSWVSLFCSLSSVLGDSGNFGSRYPLLDALTGEVFGNSVVCSTSQPSVASPVSTLACTPFLWSPALVSVTCSDEGFLTSPACSVRTSYSGPSHSLYPILGSGSVYFRKPTWRDVGKWAWSYRKVLQLLYQLRFLLYLLAKLKVLGKWALRFKIVALIYKHLEFIMKHLEKLKPFLQAFLKWRLVRKLLSQIRRFLRRYFRWSVLWRLLKRLTRKRK